MKISKKGLDELIKSHEGYHSKQPDGSCKAYRCPAGVWTCGYGCTAGVNQHTHWSEAEAEEALASEMAKHEANVEKLVKVPLDQGQFDALVSLCYNIGEGNFGSSTLLKHLNAGDYARAASHFGDWKYATIGDESTAKIMKIAVGTKAVLPGLVERRANEATAFLRSSTSIAMPQKVEPPRTKFDLKQIGTRLLGFFSIGSAGGGALALFDGPIIPPVPKGLTESAGNIGAWGKLVPFEQWKMLALGTVVFLCIAAAASLMQRAK